jgi:hypothetical protein
MPTWPISGAGGWGGSSDESNHPFRSRGYQVWRIEPAAFFRRCLRSFRGSRFIPSRFGCRLVPRDARNIVALLIRRAGTRTRLAFSTRAMPKAEIVSEEASGAAKRYPEADVCGGVFPFPLAQSIRRCKQRQGALLHAQRRRRARCGEASRRGARRFREEYDRDRPDPRVRGGVYK